MRIRAIKNEYVFSLITKVSMVLLSFMNTIIINRGLGAELKGEYAYTINIVNIISLIISLGIGQSYSYYKKQKGEKIREIIINIITIQTIIIILIIAAMALLGNSADIILILILSCVTSVNSQIGFIAIVDNINERNKINIISSIIYSLTLIIFLIVLSGSLQLFYIAYTIRFIVDSIIIVYNFKLYPKSLNKPFKNKEVYYLYKIGISSMLMTLLMTFNYNIDVIILKHYVDYNEIGIYSVGVTLVSMLWVLPDSFKEVLFGKTSKGNAIQSINKSLMLNLIICTTVIIGFIFLGEMFIIFTYGNEFIRAYDISIVLFLGVIPMIFYKLIHTIYISDGKQKKVILILFISVLTNIILNFSFVPKYGIMGSACASVLSYSISGVTFLIIYLRDYKLKIQDIFLSLRPRKK